MLWRQEVLTHRIGGTAASAMGEPAWK